MDLDSLNLQELQEFIESAEADPKKVAKELFPTEQGAVRAVNIYIKYCKERAELLKHASFNRQDKVRKLKEKCDNIYRTLPDFSQW